MKHFFRGGIFNFVMVFLFIFGFTAQSIAKPLIIKLGHGAQPGSTYWAAAEEFGKRANAKLGDKAKIEVYGSAQLGKDIDLLKKLKMGTVELSELGTVMSSVSDMFGVFEMPYLVKDRNHLRKIRDQLFWSKIAPTFEPKGYKILALWENGIRHITNNIRPIIGPDDLKDIKLRVPKGVWRVKMFKAYGANPTPMAYSEVFMALQTGVIDGEENPLAQIYAAKFQEVQKYLSLSGHVYNPTVLAAGLKTWNGLPADVREIIKETALEVQDFALDYGEKLDRELLVKLKKDLEINEVNKDLFIKGSRAIYEEFDRSVPGGKELIEQAQALAQ